MRQGIGIHHPDIQTVLHREHERAKGDDAKLAPVRPKLDAARREGKSFNELGALYPKDAYLSVAPEMGHFLYLTARSIGAKRIDCITMRTKYCSGRGANDWPINPCRYAWFGRFISAHGT